MKKICGGIEVSLHVFKIEDSLSESCASRARCDSRPEPDAAKYFRLFLLHQIIFGINGFRCTFERACGQT
ncbi:hypothetical protein A5752_16630 [Mycobacterium sp. 852002-51961_SCH5331710]|nr:hypothetical protein A5752_16630 [Mycobacterium sp. 852002-51961_SCH5331710]OBG95086.1 hypothetical protein A5698_16035 [Mycobacterium sp. E136]